MKITQQMADQAALIVQAFKEGREVLERQRGVPALRSDSILIADEGVYTYELAPKEPAVCWRNEFRKEDGSTYIALNSHPTKELAELWGEGSNYIRTVKFVEVSE